MFRRHNIYLPSIIWLFYILVNLFTPINGNIIDYELMGAIPNNSSLIAANKNTEIMNNIFNNLLPNTKFLIPNKTFYVNGGIMASNLDSVIIQIDGTLIFSDNLKDWPYDKNGNPLECIYFSNINNILITSKSNTIPNRGTINGQGQAWWGIPGIGYLIHGENRPRLLHINGASNITIENILFTNSPYWTVYIENIDGLVIRYSSVINRRTNQDKHSLIDLTAFNTDGFDIIGKNVHIHDCDIWTQDDCIAVKGTSSNMLFERINASGLGLTIGSIGEEIVNNITFRDCYMHNTAKGIYIKFNYGANNYPGGLITNILYENIVIESPTQYAIWIGPAHQSDTKNLCYANPCSICWPFLRPFAKCNIPFYGNYSNITLKNIKIYNPKNYIGIILADKRNPMKNITFDNVQVYNNKNNYEYMCETTYINTIGVTLPKPICADDLLELF